MILAAALACSLWIQAAPQTAPPEPSLEAAVRRFYETQEQEDIAGYLALWSAKAARPGPDQLKYIFDSGDDKFADIQITRVMASGNRVRVRVSVRRERTIPVRGPSGTPIVRTFAMRAALAFEKEGGEWKLLREGQAADDMAAAFLEATTDDEREKVLAEEPELVGPELVAGIGRSAAAATLRQDYATSLDIYQQMVALARRARLPKEEGEALQNVANAHYYLRRYPEALAAYDERLTLERERADDGGIAQALAGVATVKYALGDYGDSLLRYREALALQEKLDDVAGIAASSLSVGNITFLQGDFPAAIAAYRRSLDLNRTMMHADGEALSLEGLGRVFTAQGDYASALEVFDAVLKDARLQGHRVRLGSASMNLGEVHFRLGNIDAAKASFETARGHFEATKDVANVGRVLQAIALTELVALRFPQAEDLYKKSRTTCAPARDPDLECQARAIAGLAYTQSAQDRYFDAAASYRKAIEEFTALKGREEAARSEIGLAQALAGAEDYAGAIQAATRARHIAIALNSDDVLWRALTAEARAVRRLGDKPRALGVARAAVSAIATLEAEALDKPGASVPADAAGALATYAVLQAETGDAVAAFATSEQLRRLEVRGGLAVNERDIARGMSPEEREQERVLATELGTYLARLARERGLPKPDTARIESLQKSIAEATEARRKYLTSLFERYPHLRVARGLAPSRAANDAAPLLDANSLLLSFVLDDEDVLVLVLGAAPPPAAAPETAAAPPAVTPPPVAVEAHVLPMKRRELAARVAALQNQTVLGDVDAWRKTSNELAALIPAAVASRLTTASHVWIVPHDVLWRVPFEGLPVGDRMLMDRASVAVGGSLDSLLRASPQAADLTSLVAIGAPDLASDRLGRLKQVAPTWPIRTVEGADAEMKAAAASYPPEQVQSVTRRDATEASARARMTEAAMLHVAAPFRVNAASPLFSPILLTLGDPTASPAPPATDASGQSNAATAASIATTTSSTPAPEPTQPVRRDSSNDGALELREIMNVTMRARLAVLSDGAALSMRDGASAADVLQWGWLTAGVPGLLVSRWSVPPSSAERLLAEFHGAMRKGVTPAAALRAAQQSLRANADTAGPVHWAGWMLLGR